MTFTESLLFSLARSLLVAAACVALGRVLAAGFAAMSPRPRRFAVALAAVPVLTPSILVGYAYYSTPLSFVATPRLHELWYALLLTMRWLPVAACVWALAPAPPISPMAAHCRRLASNTRFKKSFAFRGASRTALLVFAAVFLLAMADIETALLMNAAGWGTHLFDAHALGLALNESLARAAIPACLQLILLATVLSLLIARPGRPARHPDRLASSTTRRITWFTIATSAAAVAFVPLAYVFGEALDGLRVLIRDIDIHREIVSSLAFAVVAVVLAVSITAGVGRVRGRAGVCIAVALCVPGLVGSLVLALLLQGAFQTDALSALYDSPAPLLIALTLLLLPIAIVLHAIRRSRRRDAAVHTTTLMRSTPRTAAWSARIRWLATGRPALAVGLVLFVIAYFELTASAVLAPVDRTPAVVRLYNFMHYGRPPALSAMLAMTVAVPLVVGSLAWLALDTLNRIARRPST